VVGVGFLAGRAEVEAEVGRTVGVRRTVRVGVVGREGRSSRGCS
jgi:hypothetical protein